MDESSLCGCGQGQIGAHGRSHRFSKFCPQQHLAGPRYVLVQTLLSIPYVCPLYKPLSFYGGSFKVHIFWEGHKILPSPYVWLSFYRTKVSWRFRKILRPSQNIWTLWNTGKNRPHVVLLWLAPQLYLHSNAPAGQCAHTWIIISGLLCTHVLLFE